MKNRELVNDKKAKILIFLLLTGMPMFGFTKNHTTIEVKFIDVNTETEFATSNMPIDQLPDTFAINTNMNIGDENWTILHAEPINKSDFRKSGKLKLYLQKTEITQLDPYELLFSLPTINDTLAPVEQANSLKNVAVFSEDDWRQFEFIGVNHKALIESEIEAVKYIFKNHREGIGFKNLHVRKAILEPLNKKELSIKLLESSFGIRKKYEGIAFNTAAATIVNGFGLETNSGLLLWGQTNNHGIVVVLNLSHPEGSFSQEMVKEIESFTYENELYIVDWPKLFWGGSDKASFSDYKNQ